MIFPTEIQDAAARIVERAASRGLMLATAESCTGGLVAAALTGVPGASAVLDRGVVTYSNAAKTSLLGVPAELIERDGAVSEAVARAMARGARTMGIDLAVSITGVAGPGGGSALKPVGLVHLAVAHGDGETHREMHFGDIGREAVRLASVATALDMLLERLR